MNPALALLVLGLASGQPNPPSEPKLRRTLHGHTAAVRDVAFSPDGGTLASASDDGTVKLWDVKKGKDIATFEHPSPVLGVRFSASGRRLAAGCKDGTIKVWRVSSGEVLATCKADYPVRKVRFCHEWFGLDWFGLEWFGEDEVCVNYQPGSGAPYSHDFWVLKSGTPVGLVRFGCDRINTDVEGGGGCGPDWAVANEGPAKPGEIDLTWFFDCHLKPCAVLRGHTGGVHSLRFSPNGGKQLASGSADCTVKLWDVKAAACTATLRGHSGDVYCVRYSPDGKTLASASGDGTINLWDIPVEPQADQPLLLRALRWVSPD